MVDEGQVQRGRFLGKVQYLLVGLLVIIAGIGGILAGRSLGQSNGRTSQLPVGNEITLPSGGLRFKSGDGKLAAKIDADEGGGLFVLYNASEKPIVTIAGSTYGGGGLIG